MFRQLLSKIYDWQAGHICFAKVPSMVTRLHPNNLDNFSLFIILFEINNPQCQVREFSYINIV